MVGLDPAVSQFIRAQSFRYVSNSVLGSTAELEELQRRLEGRIAELLGEVR